MRILGITDPHGKEKRLAKILAQVGSVDMILLGGDLTDFGTPDDAERIVRISQDAAASVWAVAGNCDSAEIEERLVELGVSLFRRGLISEGLALQGLSAMPPWRSSMYQFTEEELAEALRAGYAPIADAARHVILSHPPPHGGPLDRTRLGRHVGSKALRQFIDQTRPLLVVCGHIHEARGIEKIGRTTIVNCGPARKGWHALIDLDDPDDQPRVELCKA